MKYDGFFEIKKDSTAMFQDFSFIASSVSSDDTRFMMNFVWVEKEDDDLVMIATDGMRMHVLRPNKKVIDFLGIKEGAYSVVFKTKGKLGFAHLADEKEVGKFVNWRNVIPADEVDRICEKFPIENDKTGKYFVHFSKKLYKEDGINLNYIKDLSGFIWDIKFYAPHKPIAFFADGNKESYVMPMQGMDDVQD